MPRFREKNFKHKYEIYGCGILNQKQNRTASQ